MHDLRLQDFRPRAEVRLPEHRVSRPKFPAIDMHVHLGPEFSCGWYGRDAAELVPVLDEMGVELIVDLDGGWGTELDARIAAYQARFPGRFLHFARVDWAAALRSDHPGEYAAEQLRDSVRRGGARPESMEGSRSFLARRTEQTGARGRPTARCAVGDGG